MTLLHLIVLGTTTTSWLYRLKLAHLADILKRQCPGTFTIVSHCVESTFEKAYPDSQANLQLSGLRFSPRFCPCVHTHRERKGG
jgi:hypothetical protein